MRSRLTSTAASARCVAALVAAAALAAGCGGPAGRARSAYRDPHPLPRDTMTVWTPTLGVHGGRFVIGATNAPKTFNAIMANESSSTDVTNLLYCALSDYDYLRLEEVPYLARGWTMSDDGLTYTWHLRRGAAFSDGHPITAADVRFSFEVAMDPVLHPSVGDLLKVDGVPMKVSAPDSYTVVTTLPKPYRLMVAAISSLRIMPRHVLEPAFRRGEFAAAYAVDTAPESLVTSGPWTLAEYRAGEKAVLRRNPHWFRTDARGQRLPYLDEVVFLFVPDQNTAALKFQAGELDGLDNVKPEDYATYEDGQRQGDYTLHDLGPRLNSNFLWFNLNTGNPNKRGRPPGRPFVDPAKYGWFSHREFRQAVSRAIDRDAIIRSVFHGNAVKNWSTTTAGNRAWHVPDITRHDYDPDGARRLLASLGWKDGNRDGFLEDESGRRVAFTLKTNADNVVRIQMANMIKDDLAAVGIDVTLAPVDFNTLITNLRADFDYDAILLGQQTGVPPDPGMGQNVWRSSGRTHYWNVSQERPGTAAEASIDRWMGELVENRPRQELLQIWTDVQNTVNDECWFVWLPTVVNKVPVRNGFGNVLPSVIPHALLWNIEWVYAKPGAGRS
jgi:peptide/nickel transport system substrate-binding protein